MLYPLLHVDPVTRAYHLVVECHNSYLVSVLQLLPPYSLIFHTELTQSFNQRKIKCHYFSTPISPGFLLYLKYKLFTVALEDICA